MDYAPVIAQVLLIYLAAVVSPGPNFAVVSRLSLTRSRTDGLAATVGIAVASTSYALITMLGLSALLQTLDWLDFAVRLGSGAFLVYLGWSAWTDGPTRPSLPDGWQGINRAGQHCSFRSGLLVGFSNPKALAFFTGLYAVAVPLDSPVWTKGTILAGSFTVETIWYSLVAYFLSSKRAQSLYQRSDVWIERAFGTVLILIGLSFLAKLAGVGQA